MLNLLIADDNIDYVKNLMHYVNSISDNIRVSDISINGKETLEILNVQNNIDIVLLDLKMPLLSGIEIIKQLSDTQVNKYTKSCIIISSEMQMIEQARSLKSEVIYKIIPKNIDLESITNNIKELITEKDLNIKEKNIKGQISNELTSIGYSISHNGTQYLIDIIEMLYYREGELIENLSKYVYPIIAKRYNQTSNNIKTSISRATESMYYDCDEKRLIDYFNLNIIKKPKTKTVINTVLLKIKEE